MISEFISKILLWSLFLTGVEQIPSSKSEINWIVDKTFAVDNMFSAHIDNTENLCKGNEYLVLPVVFYGYQELILDSKSTISFGSKNFDKPISFTSEPHISCSVLKNIKTIEWTIYPYSKYFARFKNWPKFSKSIIANKIFSETQYIGSSIGLLLIAIFSFFIMFKREKHIFTFTVFFSAIFCSFYIASNVSNFFLTKQSILTIHKIGDFSLSVGFLGLVYIFYIEKHITSFLFKSHLIATVLGSAIIYFGDNGDVVQFGTTLPFVSSILVLFSVSLSSLNELKNNFSSEILLKFLSAVLFSSSCFFDILFFTGETNGPSLTPIGFSFAFLLLVLSVNQRITGAYTERDYLRKNLEKEVKTKTEQLSLKTIELESALSNLKKSQAEIIHSAKLASLGTVSAGLAHEINNSINYINGAIIPLERKVNSLIPDSPDKIKINTLFKAIKEGTSITIEIIKSLRNFTGLNHADFKDIYLNECINSTLIILKSKTRDIKMLINIDPTINSQISGNIAGLNQILMNLISNAIDSLDKPSKQISISTYLEDKFIFIRISDNGCGINDNLIDRIFDPFFTTKEVGKGTGLGLHIVQKEVERHKGTLSLKSELGNGTTFTLKFPSAENMVTKVSA